MKQSSSKSLEKRLEKKKADLNAAIESRKQIEQKIKGLREEIETLQSTQLEQVFQQVKKSILKEGLHVDAENVSGILQSIRENQDTLPLQKHEPMEEMKSADNLQEVPVNEHDENTSLPKQNEDDLEVDTHNDNRLP